LFGDLPCRSEERLGRLARFRDALSLILPRGQWPPPRTKQRFPPKDVSVRDIETAVVNFCKQVEWYAASFGVRVGIIETSAALGACLFVLIVAVVLDRRPYRPGKLNYIPLMIIALAASLVLGRHLLSLVNM
jgi:hypothetical protein